jgi:oligoendopeptidase F
MYPSDELKVCDVDVNNPEFIEDAIEFFKETIDEFRKIYRK